jgi:hypothetical protein
VSKRTRSSRKDAMAEDESDWGSEPTTKKAKTQGKGAKGKKGKGDDWSDGSEKQTKGKKESNNEDWNDGGEELKLECGFLPSTWFSPVFRSK